MSRSDAIWEALTVALVLGFFVESLWTGFSSDALAGLRADRNPRPTAVLAATAMRMAIPAPTPMLLMVSLAPATLVPIGTPVPVLATVDAIMTAHAQRTEANAAQSTSSDAVVPAAVSPVADQPSPAAGAGADSFPSATATRLPTATPTILSSRSTRAAIKTPTLIPIPSSKAMRTTTRIPRRSPRATPSGP